MATMALMFHLLLKFGTFQKTVYVMSNKCLLAQRHTLGKDKLSVGHFVKNVDSQSTLC